MAFKNEIRTYNMGQAPIDETLKNQPKLRVFYRNLWLAAEGKEADRVVNRAFKAHITQSLKGPKDWRNYHILMAKRIEKAFGLRIQPTV